MAALLHRQSDGCKCPSVISMSKLQLTLMVTIRRVSVGAEMHHVFHRYSYSLCIGDSRTHNKS